MGIVLAILVFGLIIFVHEMGHFLLAKANKIRVDEFSLGMGPRLFSFVKGETRYSLKLLPLGGSCMMGEDDADDVSEGSFNSKSVWARISVVVAGAAFNFLLALLCAVIVVGYTGYDEPVISEVLEGFPAQEAGMQGGDRIVSLNGKKINLWREITYYNMFHPGEKVDVVYERDGEKHQVTLTPKQDEDGTYLLGVSSPRKYTKPNAFTAIQYGAYEVKFWINTTVESLKMLVTGAAGLDQLSGPVLSRSHVLGLALLQHQGELSRDFHGMTAFDDAVFTVDGDENVILVVLAVLKELYLHILLQRGVGHVLLCGLGSGGFCLRLCFQLCGDLSLELSLEVFAEHSLQCLQVDGRSLGGRFLGSGLGGFVGVLVGSHYAIPPCRLSVGRPPTCEQATRS